MNFRQKLLRGETLIGTMITLPSSEMVEIMVDAGFDWLFIDCEHASFDSQVAQSLLQAAGERCPCVIRVPCGQDVWIKKMLDIGASGIIVPQVNSAEQARLAIQSCKYPPQGTRGVGLGRAHRYGARFSEYLNNANSDVAVILQAEHIDAVRCIDEITSLPGLDAILIGPYDLSASLGKIGNVADPEVLEAIDKVRDSCLKKELRLGYFGVSPAAVKPYMDQGYTLITVGVDVLFAQSAAADALAALREGICLPGQCS
ncbi:MAG: aldolase/citrate lyase family protein [Methylococcaceae bacterium]|nr:aldolase/citrate lyase family protein [Methylococcaceae bacterium]